MFAHKKNSAVQTKISNAEKALTKRTESVVHSKRSKVAVTVLEKNIKIVWDI